MFGFAGSGSRFFQISAHLPAFTLSVVLQATVPAFRFDLFLPVSCTALIPPIVVTTCAFFPSLVGRHRGMPIHLRVQHPSFRLSDPRPTRMVFFDYQHRLQVEKQWLLPSAYRHLNWLVPLR